MQRILSTYLFVSKKLTPEFLALIHGAGFQAIELFASRGHFDYTNTQDVRGMGQILADNRLQLASLHAPTSRDFGPNREGGTPLSITEVERVRRIEAMDELKRAIDIAENLPFSRMILHMGGHRDTADPRKRDAAFSSLEHLVLHAKARWCDHLRGKHHQARWASLPTCALSSRRLGSPVCASISISATLTWPTARPKIASPPALKPCANTSPAPTSTTTWATKTRILPPHDGSIDWPAALKLFRSLPGGELPLTLELKEKTGPDAPGLPDQITAAAKSLDRLEEDLQAP